MRTALRIALIYLVVGVVWILFTDWILVFHIHDLTNYRIFQTSKGWVFVLASTALIYVLVRSNIRRIREANLVSQESQQKFRELYENAPLGIFTTTPEGKYLSVNARLVQMHGHDSPEQFKNHITSIQDQIYVHPEERKQLIREVEKHGYVTGFESQRRKKDGTVIWVSTSMRAVRDETGKTVRFEGFTTDITQRKEAENELRHSEERYRLLVENQNDLVVKIDPEGHFLFVSPTYCDLFGKSEEELLGRKFMPLIHEEDRESTAQAMQELYRPPHSAYMEQRALTKAGWRWLAWSDKAVLDEQGDITAIVGVGRDVTERKQAEEEQQKLTLQLKQAQKMEAIGRLAGGVAHDFNNMLQIIRGYADLALGRKEHLDDFMVECMRNIEDAANRSANLTTQLLAFARKQTISPKVLDLNDVVSISLKMLGRLIGENIKLEWNPGKGLWDVLMDPAQIDQILANLAINARDAIGDVGTLKIETSNVELDQDMCHPLPGCVPGRYVLLKVSDNGIGMDRETLDQIFEPFFTTKANEQGTGLGLSTVYGIVKQNNGFIYVESEPGEGTSFRVYFPRHETHEPKAGLDKSELEAIPGGNETILVVEDRSDVLSLCRDMLEHLGYQVLTAASPAEGLELAREHQGEIHLLLTDVIMPEMNGKDLQDHVQALRPEIRTLFMSGYTAEVISQQGFLEESIHFIGKPFKLRPFAVKLREALTD